MESNIVKLEMDNICRGCLSADRYLKPLSNDCSQLFYYILGEDLLVPKKSIFCWECISILKRILIYQKRFRRSQIVLLMEMAGPCGIDSLSHLTAYYKSNYDLNLEYSEEQAEDIKIKLDISENEEFHLKIKTEEDEVVNVKEEICDEFVDDIHKDDDLEALDKIKGKVLKKKNYYTKQCKRNLKSYLVDYDNGPEGHVNNVPLNIECIKDLISKGRNKSRKHVLFKTHVYFQKKIAMMNMDLKQKEKNGQGIKCSYCEIYISNRVLLRKHWNEHTVDVMKCLYCDIISIYKSEMLQHLRGGHKYNLMCECGFECRSRKEYYIHYRKHHRMFVCDHCQSRYKDKVKLEKHMLNKHMPNKCDLCDRTYKKKSALRIHYLAIHKKTNERTNELTYCVECDIHYENTFLYKRHLRTAVAHNPRKPTKVPCPDCGKIFSRRCYMINHYNLIHKQKSKYYCEICDKYFSCAYGMRTHKKFVHLKEEKPRDKLCKICGKGFYTNRELHNHTRTHTGERPFECGFCDAAFAQDTSRKTHERTQHKEVQKCENDVE